MENDKPITGSLSWRLAELAYSLERKASMTKCKTLRDYVLDQLNSWDSRFESADTVADAILELFLDKAPAHREATAEIVKALKDAIHMESAWLAPRTSTLIEMAKLAIEKIEQLEAERDYWKRSEIYASWRADSTASRKTPT